MSDLAVDFAGLRLRNPIVAASAPPTETVENIVSCANAGVAAVVTKTSADFNPDEYLLGGRRTFIDSRGLYAQGTFRHETLTIEQGVNLVRGASGIVDIPIIASVGGMDLAPEFWLDSCLAMQDAGASMIQLDLFYVPQPRCSPENIGKLRSLLKKLADEISVPIAPKMNVDIPAHLAADVLKDTGIAAVFLIDSLRVPVPIDIQKGGTSRIKYLEGVSECSLFGEWQKPLTLQYASILYHELNLPICAGGGFMNGWDAIEAMMWGATTVQFATAIIRYGYSRIEKIRKQLALFLMGAPYNHIHDIVGLAHQRNPRGGVGNYVEARAIVDHDLCVNCGLCTRIVFCEDISLDSRGRVDIADTCDGCGLCPTVCPIPGALEVHAVV